MHFTHQPASFHPDTSLMGDPIDDQHRQFNYDLCQAINMTKMSIVLTNMVKAGVLDERLAELYHGQAGSLLALLLSENNRQCTRLHNEEKSE